MFRVCKTEEVLDICHGLLMNFFRVERNTSMLVVAAAFVGLIWANSPFWTGLDEFRNFTLGAGPVSFTLEGWVTNFGIPVFFFLVGLELKRELTDGVLREKSAILVPGLAAVFGVVVPAAFFLLVTAGNPDATAGWPIPTATDVTFSLAVLMIFGNRLPKVARTFLLSFAVIDDLIAIGIITVLFLGDPNPLDLAYAVAFTTAFAFITKIQASGAALWALRCLSLAFAGLALYNTVVSGMQASVVGLILGLLVPAISAKKLQELLHPWVAVLVLPLFALFAVGVNLGNIDVFGQPVFWAIMTRPLGKFIGVYAGGTLGKKLSGQFAELDWKTLAKVSVLAGIGFTISLLVANLTFALQQAMLISAVTATLIATLVSSILGALALVRAHRT